MEPAMNNTDLLYDPDLLFSEEKRWTRAIVEMERELAAIPMRMNDDHLYSTRDAAMRLSVSSRTMEGWRTKGTGPQVTALPNGSKRYRGLHLRHFIEANAEPANQPKRKTAKTPL